MACLMEQVILRLGYGIDEGLSPTEVTLWRFFPTPPPTKAETKGAGRTSTIASKLIDQNIIVTFYCLFVFVCINLPCMYEITENPLEDQPRG